MRITTINNNNREGQQAPTAAAASTNQNVTHDTENDVTPGVEDDKEAGMVASAMANPRIDDDPQLDDSRSGGDMEEEKKEVEEEQEMVYQFAFGYENTSTQEEWDLLSYTGTQDTISNMTNMTLEELLETLRRRHPCRPAHTLVGKQVVCERVAEGWI